MPRVRFAGFDVGDGDLAAVRAGMRRSFEIAAGVLKSGA